MNMDQGDIDRIGREVNATVRHAQLVEETTKLQRREQARDRLLIAIAEATMFAITGVHNINGALGSRYSSLYQELRDAKILFAGTLDKS